MLYYLVLALGIIATVIFLVMRVKKGGLDAAIMKATASLLFILTAVTAWYKSGAIENTFGIFVILGLVCGMLGDIWLDLKWVYPADNDKHTYTGFMSFMIGNFFFLAGLFTCFADTTKPLYIIIPAVAAVLVGLGMIALEKPMKMVYGKFKVITAIYCAVLVYMTLLSGSLALMNGWSDMTVNFMFGGGVLFLISDLILSGTYFGEGKDRPVDIITNHASYYAAQFVIASSLLFLTVG